MDPEHFYTKNTYLLESHLNITFEELLWKTEAEFHKWAEDLCAFVTYIWDTKNTPPVQGKTKDQIIEAMNEMINYPVHEFVLGEDMFYNTKKENAGLLNGWFPNLMKARINTTLNSDEGLSVYDYVSRQDMHPKFFKYLHRNLKRDSFYVFSLPVQPLDREVIDKKLALPYTDDPIQWIKQFEETYREHEEYDYWLEPNDPDEKYSGYAEHLKVAQYLHLSQAQIDELGALVPDKCKTNMPYNNKSGTSVS